MCGWRHREKVAFRNLRIEFHFQSISLHLLICSYLWEMHEITASSPTSYGLNSIIVWPLYPWKRNVILQNCGPLCAPVLGNPFLRNLTGCAQFLTTHEGKHLCQKMIYINKHFRGLLSERFQFCIRYSQVWVRSSDSLSSSQFMRKKSPNYLARKW